jgi:hypothetical protein
MLSSRVRVWIELLGITRHQMVIQLDYGPTTIVRFGKHGQIGKQHPAPELDLQN